MHRRKFLQNSAMAGASVATVPFVGCQPSSPTRSHQGTALAHPENFAWNEATTDDLQREMAAGRLTSLTLTEDYLRRIREIDQEGPLLRAVIEVNPEAASIARQMDAERAAGKIRGPLHGIPVLVKDNIDTGDRMQTTAGSLALKGHIAAEDAFIIKKLRQAGAVLLGKTNLSEWANFRSTHSCSGWSSRGGQTRSPYALSHNPCGSSSGSGVAVAANLCALAIGTETDGSITCPASANGIVGIKPTVGLWSRSGIIPISATQDTAGPMARTVKDAAVMLGALAGVDDADAVTRKSEGRSAEDYTRGLSNEGLRGRRIGIDRRRRSKHHQLNQLLEAAIAVLQKQGAEIVDVNYLLEIEALGSYELTILQHEFKDGVNKYLSLVNTPVRNLAGVIAFNRENEDQAMPYFKQEQLEACEKLGGLEEAAYREALIKGRDTSRRILQEQIDNLRLDALAGLTMGPACAIDTLYGDRYSNDFLTRPAAMSGFPHISVPAGYIFGLPVGLSLFGAPFTEADLIQMAYAFEQATQHRKKPEFSWFPTD